MRLHVFEDAFALIASIASALVSAWLLLLTDDLATPGISLALG
jgi:hypothetical protein